MNMVNKKSKKFTFEKEQEVIKLFFILKEHYKCLSKITIFSNKGRHRESTIILRCGAFWYELFFI